MKSRLIQGTPEWLAMRKNYIGASDAAIIMGVSPFKRADGLRKTPYVLWMEKLDLLPQEQETPAMRYGKAMEEPARNVYEEMVGVKVYPKVCFHKDILYLMASLDGISSDGKRAVEIKNANAEDHAMAKNKIIPPKYYPQVQGQIDCDNREWIDYFSFHKGEGVIVEVARDNAYIEEMQEKEATFWDCVRNFKAPALTQDDFIERDQEWYRLAENLLEKTEMRKSLEKEEKNAKDALKLLSDDQNSFYGDIRFSRSLRKGNVDYTKVPELLGVDLEQYRKSSSCTWTPIRK